MSGRSAKRRRRSTPQTTTLVRGLGKCQCFLEEGEHTETGACRAAERAFMTWWQGQMAR